VGFSVGPQESSFTEDDSGSQCNYMKKWTVMLIPHDRSSTQTLTLSNLHFWLVVGLLVALTFASSFFFQRHRTIQAHAKTLREVNRSLEIENGRTPKVVEVAGRSDAEVRDIEARLRAEYEQSIAAITAELNKLYDVEARARDITGLAPRPVKAAQMSPAAGDGRGGPPVAFATFAQSAMTAMTMRPPNVIYGMSRPSADLILQEIRVRTQSFEELVTDMEKRKDSIERVPSVWPLARRAGKISSSFGYRRDPFTRRIRQHDGTDISAHPGTPVRATAKGVVKFSGYEGYYGNLVVIDHGNGMQTWYAHLSRRNVKQGDAVPREAIIGAVGSTGRSTGPHLHYEVRVNGKPVDAEKYLTD
jgi:murein DD-endopeptidase MepM/ murein hydrolase activator NlpD